MFPVQMMRCCIRLSIVAALIACGSVDAPSTGPLIQDPYISLQLNARSALMSTAAPYNTLQLVATPYTTSGKVFVTDGQPTFTTKDTTVSVTSTGLVTAKTATASTFVVAKLRDQKQNVTREDTLYISVTDEVPTAPLETFSIQRPLGDSAKIPVYSFAGDYLKDTIKFVAKDGSATDITEKISVLFISSDSGVAKVDRRMGVVTGQRVGEVMIFATTTYFGVTKTDSIRMKIGNPMVAEVMAEVKSSPTVPGAFVRVYVPNTITIGVGGTIRFLNPASFSGPELEMDVVFDDPSAAQPSTVFKPTESMTGTGNIGPLPPLVVNGAFNPACLPNFAVCAYHARSFPTPGTYHYRSALYGTTGTIIVKGP